jgi:hypothetical protein
MMKLPIIEISNDDKIVLKYMVENFFQGKRYDRIEIKINLFDKLSKSFDFKQLNPLLIQGYIPTIYGLWVLNNSDKYIALADKILHGIKKFILENPKERKVTTEYLSNKLKHNKDEIAKCLEILNTVGSFYNSASSSNDISGYSEIGFDNDELIDAYLNYSNIEEQILMWIDKFNKVPEKSNFYRESIEIPKIERNTVFILMAMDPNNPELEDTHNAIKETCSRFGIKAYRVDEIEHSDVITELIIKMIMKSEYIIADLSGERPNVYYEVGFAHALGIKPILIRRKGTKLHFDLSVYNIPEYQNTTELKRILKYRLEAITGKSPGEQLKI